MEHLLNEPGVADIYSDWFKENTPSHFEPLLVQKIEEAKAFESSLSPNEERELVKYAASHGIEFSLNTHRKPSNALEMERQLAYALVCMPNLKTMSYLGVTALLKHLQVIS
jgi:hypothetical protein